MYIVVFVYIVKLFFLEKLEVLIKYFIFIQFKADIVECVFSGLAHNFLLL